MEVHKKASNTSNVSFQTTCDEFSTENSFPNRLMSLLQDEHVQKIMHWLPCGRAFEILDPELCARTILKDHFNSIKFESFIVRLKKWGFNRTDTKVNGRYRSMTFSSELFRRDEPHHCHEMKLKPNKPQKKAKSTKTLSHLFDARIGHYNATPQMSPTIPIAGCESSQIVMPSWQYPFLQSIPLSTKHSPINESIDLTIINAASNLPTNVFGQNAIRHNRYSIQQDAAMDLHYMESLSSLAVQNQQKSSSYKTFHPSQAVDSMTRPNIDATEDSVTNTATSNKHPLMGCGDGICPPVVTTSVVKPDRGQTNSEPIFPRTTRGATEAQMISSHQYVKKLYRASQIPASKKMTMRVSFSCNESPKHIFLQHRRCCDKFREDTGKPVFLTEVMEAESILNGSSCDYNVTRRDEPKYTENYFLDPSIGRREEVLENKSQSRLKSDPAAERAQGGLAPESLPCFYPINSSYNEMKYFPNNVTKNAQDIANSVLPNISITASGLPQPTAAIDLFERNRHDEMINSCPGRYSCWNTSCCDSFFDEFGYALHDDIILFAEDRAENHTRTSRSARTTEKNCTAKSCEALSMAPSQNKGTKAIINFHLKDVQEQIVEIPEIKTNEAPYGGSLASMASSEADDLDLQSLAEFSTDIGASRDEFIDFIEKTIAED